MADFRRSILVLAAVALLLGAVGTASAQTFQCQTNAGVPPLVRAEGLTELVGDLVLNCTGGTATLAGVAVPSANIQIFLNTALTSRVLVTASSLTEVLLLVDEPAPAEQVVCASPCQTNPATILGVGGAGGSYKGGRANVFQGVVAGANSVVFLGVPIDPPGTTQGTRVFRFTNVRANASGQAVAGGTAVPTQIVEVVSSSGTTSLPINNPQQIVGFVVQGLITKTTAGGPFQQCVSTDPKPGSAAGDVKVTEGFATAFKLRNGANPQNTPGAIYNSESGLFGPALPTGAGVADFATRIKLTFNTVPAGVTLYVPNLVAGTGSLRLTIVSSETAVDPGLVPITPSAAGNTALTPTGGTATAVYEVYAADPNAIESADIGVSIVYTAAPGATPPSPAFGTATVTASFAPTSTDTTAEPSSVPVPRFASLSPAANLFTIVTCASHLLFPFVTNQAGFDTGIAISNTSADPYGTSSQTGTCLLTAFGSPTLPAVTTPTVGPGTVYANLVSILFPAFQGYVFADCNFQFGHGFAFVETSGGGTAAVAQGYLALVLPDPARANGAFGVTLYGAPVAQSGEVLGQ